MIDPNAYKPISDYGAIGNLRTVAIVGLDGSIDWCCFPEIDSPSAFGAILDHQRGGHFRVAPTRPLDRRQRYVEHTNVLETTFDTEGGHLVVTDFMPLRGELDGPEPPQAPPEIHRILQAEGGHVEVEVEWAPRLDYARETPSIEPTGAGFIALTETARLVLAGLPEGAEIAADDHGPLVRARFTLQPNERIALVTRWGTSDDTAPLALSDEALEETTDAWRKWTRKEEATGKRAWAGYWSDQVIRSELAIKLMVFAPTGAIAAAPTTSLPEKIGGIRNWDYRYSWIRDSALSAQALYAMGHRQEAKAFILWSERVSSVQGEAAPDLRIMYDVRGSLDLPEEELTHLEGYLGSRPVRIGNKAAEQLQLDIYGELISAAYELVRMGETLPPEIGPFLTHLADKACADWRDPDYGIWEFRNGPHQFVYSKVMVWMALDRAARLAAAGHIQGDVARWQKTQQQILQEVFDKGYNHEVDAFTVMYGSKDLDASNLLIPLMEFLPFEDPRVQSTIDRTLERLTENDLVYRYHTDDGLPPGEGAFLLCTFWMVDALALSGRLDEAYRIFDGLTSRVNHVGLLSEQIDPHTGIFQGNFPQAFSHIGLINSALYLAHMEGRETPIPAPIGTDAHRNSIGNHS